VTGRRHVAAHDDTVAPLSTGAASPPIADFLAQAATLPPSATPHERELADRLQGFAGRLKSRRFQLAVVGQFKRGKSSLLNALLEDEVVPTGVLPLTALPTFIRRGPAFALEVSTQDGRVERFEEPSPTALQEKAAEFVAELANPANIKGVRHVELLAPSALLAGGLVLIDTPGVGSTVTHNTAAAEAALPECDAALMVLSPEPPITEAELAYLGKIRENASSIVVAFNKIDTASANDVGLLVRHLRGVLDVAGLPEARVFLVSARDAAAAAVAGDAAALAASGVPALRDHLQALATTQGERILGDAIGFKAAAAVSELLFETDLALAALASPVEDLDRRVEALGAARKAFDRERLAAADRLEGDRRRLLQQLDEDADQETAALRQAFNEAVAATSADQGPGPAWAAVRATIPERFAALQSPFLERHRIAFEAALAEHQLRADGLLDDLRGLAAQLMEVSYQAPAAEGAFAVRFEPAPIDRPRESLADGPVSLLEGLLPTSWGRRLAAKRVAGELAQLAATNVEHMRWACRQSMEDAFRRYGSDLDRALLAGAAGVTDGLQAAARLRAQGETATREALEGRRRYRDRLQTVLAALEQHSA
jgi:GTPase SAR1 family protein